MNGWTDDAHYFEETINISRVKKLLDNVVSANGVPKALEGMKWLLAQISKGRDVSDLFSSVVKLVSTKSVELKKMVYMFLVHYVDANKTCRELALLAINSYQKDLADRNQLVRALALRVLTSFRVPEICQIQLLAMRKCATDRSPFVRKTTAHSVPKLYVARKSLKKDLEEILVTLFDDRETMVLGSAMAAFVEVCPERHDMIHPHFRKFCKLLADLDEWGQIVMLNQLTHYARTQFRKPSLFSSSSSSAVKKETSIKNFYADDDDDSNQDSPDKEPTSPQENNTTTTTTQEKMSTDHKLLLRSVREILRVSLYSTHEFLIISLKYCKDNYEYRSHHTRTNIVEHYASNTGTSTASKSKLGCHRCCGICILLSRNGESENVS